MRTIILICAGVALGACSPESPFKKLEAKCAESGTKGDVASAIDGTHAHEGYLIQHRMTCGAPVSYEIEVLPLYRESGGPTLFYHDPLRPNDRMAWR